LQNDLLVMLVRPELFLPLAFCLSGLMIVAALILLRASLRHSREAERIAARRTAQTRTRQRRQTQQLFSGATAVALDEAARSTPARQRQVRMYS
jgi:uncharacterized membrane protein